MQEALADPAVDAVLIASPTDTHADLIEAAAAKTQRQTWKGAEQEAE